ncbi:MAG: sensor histidine kinase, partial [Actinomycetes bacterium]
HELRTPLAVARAKVELAERAHVDARPAGTSAVGPADQVSAPEDDVRASLAVARGELERMSRLVGDLLALGRSGHHGFLHRRDVDLRDLVRDLEVRIDGLGWDTVTVAPAPPVFVDVDAERLLQAMSNCVQNAIVHNPPGTTVDVRVSVVSDRLVIRVVDDGAGIPPADRERVLEPFVHLGPGAGQTSTGLGLAVVTAIAAAHGGEVRILGAVEDVEGSVDGSEDGWSRPTRRPGTTVEISLPVVPENSPERAIDGSAPPGRSAAG